MSLLGCDGEHWEECLQQASKLADWKKTFAQQLEWHQLEALRRSQQGPTEYDNIIVYYKQHPAMVPMHPRYLPLPGWNDAVPDINIAGLPKAGSSQLAKILTSHSDAVRWGKDKEHCVSRSSRKDFEGWDDDHETADAVVLSTKQLNVQRLLFQFYNKFASTPQSKHKGRKTVNACYWINDIEINRHYLLPPSHKPSTKKYIMLLRDPADWLWSAFNFWNIPGIDSRDYGWTDQERDYRSPELFHELITSHKNTEWGKYTFDYYHAFTIRSPRKLLGMFGPANVLFLRNEDLLPSVVDQPGGLLDQLVNFTGLERTGFDPTQYSGFTNCNDQRGTQRTCEGPSSKSSSYAMAGGRAMLPETRQLIYLQFWEECKIWAKEFGIYYPDCLNVIESTQ
jgi:hypothetical protein